MVNGAEKGADQAEQQVNIKNFMPSHQVLFRRSDGELLLPSTNPYQGQLQRAETNALNQQSTISQQLNNYGYKR